MAIAHGRCRWFVIDGVGNASIRQERCPRSPLNLACPLAIDVRMPRVPSENRSDDPSRSSLTIVALCVAAGAFLAACSLDERKLEVELGGSGPGVSGAGGDASIGGGGTAGNSVGPGGAAGEAGSDDEPIPVSGGCADLDTNRVGDCTETSVRNPDFKMDVAKWLPDMDTTIDWDSENAAGDLPSGSGLVASTGVIDATASGAAIRAAQQCIPIAGNKLVIVYANAKVDPGQDPQGRAEVDVAFYDTEDCTGPLTATFSTPQPLGARVGSWLTIKAGSVSGASTKSALVRLALLKPFRASAFQARFDNVLLRVEAVTQ